MRLFLQGQRGVGKSTLLRQVLLPYQGELAGFVTQRLLHQGRQAGFRAVLLEGGFPPLEAEATGEEAGIFLWNGQQNPSVLEEVLLQAERAAASPAIKLLCLDEIGGVEILSPGFTQALWRVLEGPKLCLGVWKSGENLRHTALMVGLGPEYLRQHEAMERRLAQGDSLARLEPGNREAVREQVLRFLKQAQ